MELKIEFNLLLLISLFVVATEIVSSISVEATGESAKSIPHKPNRKQFLAAHSSLVGGSDDDNVDDIGKISKDHQFASWSDDSILHTDEQDLQVGSSGGGGTQQANLGKQRPLISFELPKGDGEASDSGSSVAATTGGTKLSSLSTKGSFLSGSKSYFKGTIKSAYKATRKYAKDASDSIALMMAKAHLDAEIESTKNDIKSIRKEYSLFTVTWSPIMESALNYVGSKNLNQLEWDQSTLVEKLDFSRDALHTLAFGYEFVRLLNAWRESLLPVLEANKAYLQRMKLKLLEQQQPDEPAQVIDDRLYVELKVINNYLLLTGWLTYDELSKESREKLEYLINKMGVHGSSEARDFEHPYLRQLYKLAETYEKTRDKFDRERNHIAEALALAGARDDSYPDVDEFFEKFRDALDGGQLPEVVDVRVPGKIVKFLDELKPELELNPLVYDQQFLWRLNKGI